MNQTIPLKKLLPLLLIAILLAALSPRTARLGYDYKRGGTWNYETLYAPFDFPILKTSEQIEEELSRAEDLRIPYFNYSESVTREALKAAGQMELGDRKPEIVACLRSVMEKGVISDDATPEEAELIYIQRAKRATKVPSGEVLTQSEARERLAADLQSRIEADEEEAQQPLLNSVLALVTPNLTYDPQTTETVNAAASKRISPTMGTVTAGQLIVSEGEIITAEIAQILDSYEKEYQNNVGHGVPSSLGIVGNAMLALLLVTLLAFVIYYSNKRLFHDKRYYYILFVFTLASAGIIALSRFAPGWLWVAPLTLMALYLQAFVRGRVIVPVYMVALLPLLVFADRGVTLYLVFLAGGVVSILGFQYLGRSWRQFLLALVNFAVMAVAYLGLRFVGVANGVLLSDLIKLFVASVLAVFGYPLIYLFEKMFNLVSDSRLAELADTSSPLLRELEQKAPGTFQHSLQVMNMADAAARSITANPLLIRVGALYHDIGKIANPQCFIENESMLNKSEDQKYHTGLTPEQSAEDIIKHVADGVELARKHRLPDVVVDFIRTHHGTSVTGYFWGKYISLPGSNPDERPRFSYPGPKPVTKEQIVLMLCDSIEAASRTLTEYTPEAFSAFVERIVKGKMDEGQFAGAEISIKELGEVKEAIKAYLAQMHHGRVVYPSARKNIFKFK